MHNVVPARESLRRFAFFALAAALLLVSGFAHDRRADRSRFSIMSERSAPTTDPSPSRLSLFGSRGDLPPPIHRRRPAVGASRPWPCFSRHSGTAVRTRKTHRPIAIRGDVSTPRA